MTAVESEVAGLVKKPIRELRRRYAELFGDETKTANKAWLVKRIAWRLQSNAEGGLSERARRRAAELANEADIRLSPPRIASVREAAARTVVAGVAVPVDDRLPIPGTMLVRMHKGREHHVLVLADGFEHGGQVFRSLSAVAKHITGSHCNGYLFFRLSKGTTE